jgi:hypothetical protein
MLFSKKFFDDTFGVLASVAYQSRNIREVGYSAVDVLASNTNGLTTGGVLNPFCTPIGWTGGPQSPATAPRAPTPTTAAPATRAPARSRPTRPSSTCVARTRRTLPAVVRSSRACRAT